MNILVIAPHPDDEVLGCGGTIKKMTIQGHHVYRCIVTRAYRPDWSSSFLKNRKKEIINSGKILGFHNTLKLNLPTVKLDTLGQRELNQKIALAIKKVNPGILYIPFYGDLNKDHRLIYESSLVASRPFNNKIHTILMYEVLSETEWGISPFIPQLYEDISLTFEDKINAMKAYKSELRVFPHPRSLKGIEILAKKRGIEVCLKMCEAFQIVRIVNKIG